MKVMQPESKNLSDLEYLANIGLENVAHSENDIHELRSAIKKRAVSFNSGNYFGFISLITGIFIGVSVFFMIYNAPRIFVPKTKMLAQENIPSKNIVTPVLLDTVKVTEENFVKQNLVQTKKIDVPAEDINVALRDSATEIASLPLPVLTEEKITEAKIKFIPNAPVIYLHDLKVTDYHSLYFNKNKFVSLRTKEGLSASYANKEDYKKDGNLLEPVNNYFLHQAIADAMLLFKNKNYTLCLNALNNVSAFSGNDINCRFYSGMCYYNKKNYTEAVRNFNACILNSNNVFLPEAEYYKALCLLKMGNKEEALIIFKKIVDDGEFYSEKARQFY